MTSTCAIEIQPPRSRLGFGVRTASSSAPAPVDVGLAFPPGGANRVRAECRPLVRTCRACGRARAAWAARAQLRDRAAAPRPLTERCAAVCQLATASRRGPRRRRPSATALARAQDSEPAALPFAVAISTRSPIWRRKRRAVQPRTASHAIATLMDPGFLLSLRMRCARQLGRSSRAVTVDRGGASAATVEGPVLPAGRCRGAGCMGRHRATARRGALPISPSATSRCQRPLRLTPVRPQLRALCSTAGVAAVPSPSAPASAMDIARRPSAVHSPRDGPRPAQALERSCGIARDPDRQPPPTDRRPAPAPGGRSASRARRRRSSLSTRRAQQIVTALDACPHLARSSSTAARQRQAGPRQVRPRAREQGQHRAGVAVFDSDQPALPLA